jgi:hypothetical protein
MCPVSSALFVVSFLQSFFNFFFRSSLIVISYYFIQLQPQHIATIAFFLHGFDYNINYQLHMMLFQPYITTQQFHIMMSLSKSRILQAILSSYNHKIFCAFIVRLSNIIVEVSSVFHEDSSTFISSTFPFYLFCN